MGSQSVRLLIELAAERLQAMDGRASQLLEGWPDKVKAYSGDQKVDSLSNGKQITTQLNTLSSIRQ